MKSLRTTSLLASWPGRKWAKVGLAARSIFRDLYLTKIVTGTWYNTGLGSCGITNTDSDLIAAVSHILYDSYP